MNYRDVGLGDPGPNKEWLLTERDDVGSSVEILPYDTRPLHRGALRIK
jgi:hypothetical protein